MHILEIPSFFTPYGGEFCLEQSKALKALGHEVRILSNVQLGATIGIGDYLRLPFRRYEHTVEGIAVSQSYQRGLPLMVRYNVRRWIDIVGSMFADYVVKYGQPDILHAHCAKWAGYAAMQISRNYRIPYVITEHLPKEILAQELGTAPSSAWQIPLLTQAYHEAAMVITVSEELVDELACYFGKNYRHQTVSNIIDVDFFAYRSREPLEGRPFRFCCPAVFDERKGYDVLIRAFSEVLQQVDAQLYIAGFGTDGKALGRLIKSADCQDRIVCRGPLDKAGVRKMLYESDALVLATRGESQGLVLLEAMSTGIPAISTEGIPASVRPDCGFRYVPVDDAEALAEEMLKAVRQPVDDGRGMSAAVRRLASPEIVGRKIDEIFSEVLKG